MEHELKTWSEYFQEIALGNKRFEYRRNDRDFQVGDTLLLREYDANKGKYTGAAIHARVDYVMKGEFGIVPGYCIMSITPTELADREEGRDG